MLPRPLVASEPTPQNQICYQGKTQLCALSGISITMIKWPREFQTGFAIKKNARAKLTVKFLVFRVFTMLAFWVRDWRPLQMLSASTPRESQ